MILSLSKLPFLFHFANEKYKKKGEEKKNNLKRETKQKKVNK